MVNRERKLYKRGSVAGGRALQNLLFVFANVPTVSSWTHGGNRYAKSVTGCHNSHHRRANRSRTPSQSCDERLGTGPNSSPSFRGICVSFRSFPPPPFCGDSSPNLEKTTFLRVAVLLRWVCGIRRAISERVEKEGERWLAHSQSVCQQCMPALRGFGSGLFYLFRVSFLFSLRSRYANLGKFIGADVG